MVFYLTSHYTRNTTNEHDCIHIQKDSEWLGLGRPKYVQG